MATAKELELLEKELAILRDISKEASAYLKMGTTKKAHLTAALDLEQQLITAMQTAGKITVVHAGLENDILATRKLLINL